MDFILYPKSIFLFLANQISCLKIAICLSDRPYSFCSKANPLSDFENCDFRSDRLLMFFILIKSSWLSMVQWLESQSDAIDDGPNPNE